MVEIVRSVNVLMKSIREMTTIWNVSNVNHLCKMGILNSKENLTTRKYNPRGEMLVSERLQTTQNTC